MAHVGQQKKEEFEVVGDNRNISSMTAQQNITTDQITEMKESGKKGVQIIEKLIENSTTFNLKTQFSKEKWLRKKQQKYMVTFEVRKPVAMELCELHH